MESLLQDLRFTIRTVLKSPGFLLVAVLSLALGIGANTAIFSLINAVMLRLLPVPHPEQLVLLTDPAEAGIAVETTEHGVRSILSYPEFDQLRAHNQVFSGLFAAQSQVESLDMFLERDGREQSTKAQTQLVSGEFFGVLGLTPALGRVFTPAEDQTRGANPVAVLSYGFWQREFAGDAAALSRTFRLGHGTFQVIGVAPRDFRGIVVGADTDLWIPISMQAQVLPGRDYLTPRDTLWLQVMGRLVPGMPIKRAEAGINVTFQQVLHEWAVTSTPEQRRGMFDQQIQFRNGAKGMSELRGEFSDPLVLLMAMAGLVLLIACANIANLLLARANGRQREIGVRLALGANRFRLVRHLLTESLLVATLGGILGSWVAVWGRDLLVAAVSGGPGLERAVAQSDLRVLLFTAGATLATALLFGLLPSLRATRVDIQCTLGSGTRGTVGGRGRVKTGRILVVAQVAISLVLLIGATLFLRSLRNLVTQKLGFLPERILMIRVDPMGGGYYGASSANLLQQLRQKLRSIPGVQGVTLSNYGLFDGDSGDPISLDGSPVHDRHDLRSRWTLIGPDYFRTLGVPLLRGREVDSGDAARRAQVCVVNESFARFFFPNSDPLGHHVTDEYPTTRETYEIVGVVADAKEHHPAERSRPRFYANVFHPIGTVESVTFLLRAAAQSSDIALGARQAIEQADRGLPILQIQSATQQISRTLVTNRLTAELSAFFGGLALLLAAVGLYGVMSYAMARRTSEIGVRMALGATHTGVLRMVLRETLWLVGAGVAIGLPCALASGHWIAGSLFGLKPADGPTILLALAILFATTAAAGYIPARRAARIDPMTALRQE
ncbi:MAG TPA: ABC transporter permease [Bryobacteraceae bacterium]|nr:ABC transporter permease [Bryobacteraceae bacterium]